MTHGTTELRVRYSETDQMGVVYHANYLVWCEVGRTALMRQIGLPYTELERAGIFLAVAEASLRYHAPARYDDEIRVRTEIETVRSRAVVFLYTIFRQDDGDETRLVTARTTLVARAHDGAGRTLPEPLLRALRGDAVR